MERSLNRNNKLREALWQTGMTNRQLARKTGIPEAAISGFLHGRVNPRDEEIDKIARVLQRSPQELF